MQREEACGFSRGRRARDAQAEAARGFLRGSAGTRGHAAGERLRGFEIDGVVERDERLERRVRLVAAQRADLAVRRVEGRQRGIRRGAAPLGVERAAVHVFAGAVLPVEAAAEGRRETEVRLRRTHRRAVHFARKQPARRERLVAHHLGAEPEARPAREQPVAGVALGQRGRDFRRLPIRRRGHEQPEKLLHVPLFAHQLGGQPVEQLGVRRQLALRAEFLARPHDAGAEDGFPKAVRGHARRERIGVVHQPAREREAVLRRSGGEGRKRRGHALLHLLGQREIIAAKLHPRLALLPGFKVAHDGHSDLFHVGKLLAQRGDSLLVGLPVIRRRRSGAVGLCGGRGCGFHLCLQRGDFRLPLRALRLLLIGVKAEHGGLVLAIRVLRVVQKREDLEILRVRDRVVFVRVALRAGEARAHPDRHRRVRAIHHRGVAKLLVVRHRVAVEGGRDELLVGRARQQVAGDLLDGELIERPVRIERADDVIAIAPDRAPRIVRVTRRVGIAREVQPLPRPVLAIRGRRQQPVHIALVGVGRFVLGESIRVLRRRRQPREIQRRATRQRETIRLRLRSQPLLFQPREDERIHAIPHPRLRLRLRHCGPARLFIRPMFLVLPAVLHPRLQQRDFFRRKFPPRLRRRHEVVLVARRDPRHQRALLRMPRHDRRAIIQRRARPFLRVQPQAPAPILSALALIRIRPVAFEANIGKDRPNLPLEIRSTRRVQSRRKQPGGERDGGDAA